MWSVHGKGDSMLGVIFLSALLLGGGDSESLLADGDQAFARIDYAAAISCYEEALRAHQGDPEVLWRLSRVYVCEAEVAGERAQPDLLNLAEQYARQCVAAAPDRAEGHTWLAGALGYIALRSPAGDQIKLSHELVQEVDRALAINPRDDAAYSIKGSFYRALGNIGWLRKKLASIFLGSVPEGGFEEAEQALQRAVALAPDIMRHQYELGVLYLDMGKVDDAAKCLQQASTLPVRVAIDRQRQVKIRELLQELKGSGKEGD